ncbi:MAG: ParB/RepB/Spo0J family partition protein [Nitrosomonadaceae bacterium]
MTETYDVQEIELTRIYNDSKFNCRGAILPMDVVDLAKDIDANELQFPIAVQPASDVDGGLPDGYDFRIVAGHRRFVAFKILKRSVIPVLIKRGYTELKARLVNLSENLKRKELNILQEARAVKRLRDFGMIQETIASTLGMSRGWVQVRFKLLDLPRDIQEIAAAGVLNQYQIRQISDLKEPNRQYEAVRRIKNARLSGERGIDVGKKPQEDPFKKKRQPKGSVQEMMNHMMKTVGYGLHTRVLAWANGEINSAELFFDIRRFAKENDIEYTVPIKGVTS